MKKHALYFLTITILLVASCEYTPDYNGQLDTEIKCLLDFIEITDTSVFVSAQAMEGLGQKIEYTGIYVSATDAFGYLKPEPVGSSISFGRSHNLVMNYTNDTIFIFRGMVRFNDTMTLYSEEELIVETRFRSQLDNYFPND